MFRFAKASAIVCLLIGTQCAFAKDSRSVSFNDGWHFQLGGDDHYELPTFNDSGWRSLTLPHDWAIEGTFSESNPSGTGGGALPGGLGWYRKTFKLNPADKGKKVYVDFDGVYMNATVYVNGHELGTRPYGYASFSYDITPYVNFDGDNCIAVRVDNQLQPNSRWYSGCGIYRNVWLRILDSIHVAQWGTFVTTGNVSAQNADVEMTTTVENTSKHNQNLTLTTRFFAPSGEEVASLNSKIKVAANASTECKQQTSLKNPALWSVDAPNLYRVVTELSDGKKLIDSYETTIGVRYYNFDPATGFSLNGKPMKINGVCLHHDLGALGAVVNVRGIQRQLEIMKEMGANAIRTSHNPPAPELLDLCDRMGLIVMDEAFDMWRKRKTTYDYSQYFGQWHERDLDDMLRRDRNHPSILMWSIGNEVLEQWTDASADTLSLEEANMILNFGHGKEMLANGDSLSVNSLLTKKLADRVRMLDTSRPITAGCNEPDPNNHLFKSDALDLIGYNYHETWFEDVPKNFPGKPFILTESVSALMTRGYYRMPSDSTYMWPVRWDIPFYDESFACSSYDNCRTPWGRSHENSIRDVRKYPYICGQFVWTGFDYIGEPTPYGWPARSSYFGIVDLAGFPKDVYYMYQSVWRDDVDVLYLFPHWNHQPGEVVDLWVYCNHADEVELFLNGKSLGTKQKGEDDLHLSWRVDYEPGIVEAVSRKDGKEVARRRIQTAGEPAAIRLTPDRTAISADGSDLSYVTVEVVDKEGVLCPLADNDIHFEVVGAGFNAGVDNGSQTSLEPFKADSRHAFYGKAMLIVQNNGNQGDITIRATADGLQSAVSTVVASQLNEK
jgi:beta-galactosidase